MAEVKSAEVKEQVLRREPLEIEGTSARPEWLLLFLGITLCLGTNLLELVLLSSKELGTARFTENGFAVVRKAVQEVVRFVRVHLGTPQPAQIEGNPSPGPVSPESCG